MPEPRGPLWRRLDWRRWLGHYKRHTPREQRRASIRYPTHLASACRRPGSSDSPVTATIQNISLGGLNLIVDQPFESGALLEVRIDSDLSDTPEKLLVRVIHVSAQADGRWSLGCAFTRPVEELSLRNLQGPQPQPLTADKRAWVRHPCTIHTTCHSNGDGPAVSESARILDISRGGLALLVTGPFEAGTLLAIDLPLGSQGSKRRVLARVVHRKGRDGRYWVLGCAFTQPLSPEELQALMR
jgi:hypothetical protein